MDRFKTLLVLTAVMVIACTCTTAFAQEEGEELNRENPNALAQFLYEKQYRPIGQAGVLVFAANLRFNIEENEYTANYRWQAPNNEDLDFTSNVSREHRERLAFLCSKLMEYLIGYSWEARYGRHRFSFMESEEVLEELDLEELNDLPQHELIILARRGSTEEYWFVNGDDQVTNVWTSQRRSLLKSSLTWTNQTGNLVCTQAIHELEDSTVSARFEYGFENNVMVPTRITVGTETEDDDGNLVSHEDEIVVEEVSEVRQDPAVTGYSGARGRGRSQPSTTTRRSGGG